MLRRFLPFLLLLPLATPAAEPATLIRLCHDDVDLAPWVLRNGKGLSQDLILMAAQHIQPQLEIEMLPIAWPRCLKLLENGQVDGAFSTSYMPTRLDYAVFPSKADGQPDPTRRLSSLSYSLYVGKAAKIEWNGRKLRNLNGPIGIQHGFSIGQLIAELGAEAKPLSRDTRELLRHVAAGHVEAAALQTFQADLELSRDKVLADQVQKLPQILTEKNYYLSFSRQFYRRHTDLVQQFWQSLQIQRESPAYRTREKEALEHRSK